MSENEKKLEARKRLDSFRKWATRNGNEKLAEWAEREETEAFFETLDLPAPGETYESVLDDIFDQLKLLRQEVIGLREEVKGLRQESRQIPEFKPKEKEPPGIVIFIMALPYLAAAYVAFHFIYKYW